jgi:acetyl esterase/lipase
MRRICLSIVLFFPLRLSAQTIKIWDGTAMTCKQQHSEYTVHRTANNPAGIAVIVCPGGSYSYLGMDKEGHEIAEWLNKCGITAFVLRYRIGWRGNHHPAMIQDLQRTIQLVKEKSAEYGINPDKVGVMGFSAGGHLAGVAATYSDINFMEDLGVQTKVSLRPDFVAMIYPVVSMTDSIAHKRSRRALLTKHYTLELQQMMSLEQNAHKDMPPMFIVQCRKDRTVDYRNALYYQQALAKAGVACDFTLYEEGGHGFGINPNRRAGEAAKWNEKFIPWLQQIINSH